VAAIVLALHVGWVAVYFAAGHEVRDFAHIGPYFVKGSTKSDVIRYDPSYRYPLNHDAERQGGGYDGQFYYYLALDPAKAHYYMDAPGYRYLRPLYPALARYAALAQPAVVPWTLLILNVLAAALGTFLLARWLAARGHAPYLALLYGLSPGLLVATQRDLTESLAYSLVSAAVLALNLRGRRGELLSALLFMLAVFARQTTAVFVPVFALVVLLRGGGPLRARVRRNALVAAGYVALAALPYAAYSYAINAWLGHSAPTGNFTPIPLGGLFQMDFQIARQGVSLVTVVVPALIFMGLGVRYLRERSSWPAALALELNGLAFVVFGADSGAFPARSRITLGIVMATVWLLPRLIEERGPRRAWLVAAVVLWLGMLPVIAVYGMTGVQFAGYAL
jgi:hypothetical protein